MTKLQFCFGYGEMWHDGAPGQCGATRRLDGSCCAAYFAAPQHLCISGPYWVVGHGIFFPVRLQSKIMRATFAVGSPLDGV
jgi:hypothetical protein